MNRGFVSIPILIAIIVGTILVGGGGYLATKEISSNTSVETHTEADSATTDSTSITTEQGDAEVPIDENSLPQDTAPESTSGVQSEVQQPIEKIKEEYLLDSATLTICDKVREEEISTTKSLLGDITLLCNQAENNLYNDEFDFNQIKESIHEKWELWLTVESVANKETDDENESKKPEVSYSASQCMSQKESFLSQVDSAYLSWYDDWQDARTELDSCYNSNHSPLL